jgi:hypothetical protein
MTERYTEGPEVLLPPDPELEAISDRLGAVSERLGFTETGEIAERRTQLLREISLAGGFNRDNQVHVDHLRAYQDLGIDYYKKSPNPYYTSIGYHIAMARVWLEADEVGRFYEYIYGYEDDPEDGGVIRELSKNVDLNDTFEEVYGVLGYLESLNTNNTISPEPEE